MDGGTIKGTAVLSQRGGHITAKRRIITARLILLSPFFSLSSPGIVLLQSYADITSNEQEEKSSSNMSWNDKDTFVIRLA